MKIKLKPGKEKPVLAGHHWIFSGAVEDLPSSCQGEIVPVYSSKDEFLGSAMVNSQAKTIVGRMISLGEGEPMKALFQNLEEAIELRARLFDPKITNAYRLVNGEGDRLPGLVVDRYGPVLVIQIATLGMDRIKEELVAFLVKKLAPEGVYEKSLQPSRKEEGLKEREGVLYGKVNAVTVLENGCSFVVSPIEGQKTGFFLDQRGMRKYVESLSRDKTVLNAFSYTGGFSVYALKGGAARVDSLDCSQKALELAAQNATLNGFDKNHRTIETDAFEFLRSNPLDYSLVILDPPALAKRKNDVVSACRAYKEMNRQAMKKMPPHSWLVTCSCSYHVDETLFQQVVFQAALEAKRGARIVHKHSLAEDHPINLYHPESNYLKSLVLYLT